MSCNYDNHKQAGPRWVWFITGPTACGKTTVAKALSQALGFTFVEGDDVRITPCLTSHSSDPFTTLTTFLQYRCLFAVSRCPPSSLSS
jgi:hypothetical protein